MTFICNILALAVLLFAQPAWPQEEVRPSAADPRVAQFDSPSLILGGGTATRGSPLVVFLPGTGGTAANAPRLFLETVARQGYRVVFLSYADQPSVSQVCPARPPACSALFRASRSFGEANDGPVGNAAAEAIVPRLTALLAYLDRVHPAAGWGDYVASDRRLIGSRIILSGLSQGAGMAAFIAKRVAVRRVVLFSSPWDVTGLDRHPAPWLSAPSATPPDRWWAERHVRENTTDQIARAFAALRIPPDHIILLHGSPPAGARGDNPFHTSTVRLPEYVPEWRALFGEAVSDR